MKNYSKQPCRKGDKELHNLESAKGLKDRRRAEHEAEWQEKVLYGQFLKQTENESNEKTWEWLKRGEL